MKAGWEVRLLGEVVSIIGGGTPPKNNPAYYDGSIPWATVRDMNVDVITTTDHSITEAGLSASSSKVIPAGEVVIASRVGLGKVCILGQDTAINQDLRGLVPRSRKALDRRFLFYWYKSAATLVVDAGTGATVQGVTLPFLKSLPIPLPPLEEQQRIVAVLDEAFEGLTRARDHAEANLQNARELFENSLISIFDNLEATAPRLTLAQASITFGRGKSRHRPRNAPFLYGGDYPFVQTGDIRNSSGTVSTYTQTYSEHGLAQSKLWPAGTVCITIAANIAETAVLGFDACFPDSIVGMVANPDITFPEYVEFMLRYFAAELKALGKGSAQDNINLATFEAATFPFPAIATQVEVVEKLNRLTDVTSQLATTYETKIRSFDALRQSLLQKAFAGELT